MNKLQGQARAILQYEEVLKEILREEAEKIAHTDIQGKTPWDVASQYKFNQGVLEGFKRLIRKLNKLAQ